MAASMDMENVLKEIDLHALSVNFREQKINIDNVLSLTDQDLTRVGVTTIGDRIRLREKVSEIKRSSLVSWDEEVEGGRENMNISSGALDVRHQRNLLFSRPHGHGRKRASERGSTNPSKRSRTLSSKTCKSKRTWTVSVVCLSDKDTNKVPTAEEKETLYQAGLGLKKIKLDLDDEVSEVMEKISTDEKDENGEVIGFPKLKNCGGYELLKCQSNNKNLTMINCEWNVKSLRSCIGPQAKIFVRPIQVNLSTEPIEKCSSPISPVIKESCRQCKLEFPIAELREHSLVCFVADDVHVDETITPYSESVSATIDQVQVHAPVGEPAIDHATVNPTDSESILHYLIVDQTSLADIPEQNFLSPVLTSTTDMTETQSSSLQNESESFSDTPIISSVEKSISDSVSEAINQCVQENIENPVEILRLLQSVLVKGRKLDIDDTTQAAEGPTNFIIVDRANLLETAFEELSDLHDLRLTLEVQFYNEVAVDLHVGGPRKEFFRLALLQIKEKYFDHGLRELLAKDYEVVGKLFSLSMLQNGKIPQFMSEEIENLVFSTEPSASPCIKNIRNGLDSLGMYTVGVRLPMIRYLLRPMTKSMTVKSLINLLRPDFSEHGSNSRRNENVAYSAFTRYLRKVASGHRGIVTLEKILMFATGASEEPVLGFSLHPTLEFVPYRDTFIPTANTCSNSLKLPIPCAAVPLPAEQHLFNLYDYAFSNTYYGMY